MDPAVPRADRARRGCDRPLRGVRHLAGQPETRRDAADQHPRAAVPALPGGRARRCAAARRYFRDQYMTVDARSLGFGRIILSVILLMDLLHRARVIELFYSNQGLIPNHMMLWRPPTQ